MKWFKHDSDMHQNRKIRKLIRTHGATGYAFWCVLLEKIYSVEGNFQILADELWFEDIAEDLKLGDYRTPIRILDTLSELNLISSQLWQDYVIAIPSVVERGDQYLVKRASEAEKKRKQRAKKEGMSPRDKIGTKGQSAKMSPSDPDLDLDPDPDQKKIDQDPVLPISFLKDAHAHEENLERGGEATEPTEVFWEIDPAPSGTQEPPLVIHQPLVNQTGLSRKPLHSPTPNVPPPPLPQSEKIVPFERNSCQEFENAFRGRSRVEEWKADTGFLNWLSRNIVFDGRPRDRGFVLSWIRNRVRDGALDVVEAKYECYAAQTPPAPFDPRIEELKAQGHRLYDGDTYEQCLELIAERETLWEGVR